MSMSTHIVGFRPADEKWKQMKNIWESCESANIPIPNEVLDFFDHTPPRDKPGSEVELGEAVQEWSNEYSQGYELNLSKIPNGVNVIRFYNSW